MTSTCSECGRDKKRPGPRCARCYMRDYFTRNPAAYARHKKRVAVWNKANPRKREAYRRTMWLRAAQKAKEQI